MLAYIHEQPVVWQGILRKRDQLLAPFAQRVAAFKPRRVLAVGSGSSYNAAYCVRSIWANEAGIELTPVEPTRVDDALRFLDPKADMIVIVSQSGESTSTIGILSRLRVEGYLTVGITQVTDSSVAKNVDILVPLDCGEEAVGPKTKGFTATVLTLQLMALCFAPQERAQALLPVFEQAAALAPDIILHSTDWVLRHADLLTKAHHLLLLSDGEVRNALMEGALKLLETLYIPVVSYEFEEYLHGIQCTIGSESRLILVIPDNADRDRMLRLAAFNQAHGGKNLIISTGKPTGLDGELFLSTADDHYTACYDVLLPLQLISTLISVQKGINCDKSKFPTFVKELATKNW